MDSVLLAVFKDVQQLRLLSWPNSLTSLSKKKKKGLEGRKEDSVNLSARGRVQPWARPCDCRLLERVTGEPRAQGRAVEGTWSPSLGH